MNFTDFIWLLLLLSILTPMLRQRWIEAQRIRLIRRIEEKRKSRVITLIHRQESLAFLGIPLSRYIDIDDSEAVLRAIRLTPSDMPIDLILHTPGGLVLASEQIADALLRHQAPVTVMVPHYALSGGTLIALAADEIQMDPNAVLGPVDPQIGEYPAASLLEVLDSKPIDKVEDHTLILASVGRKALAQVSFTVVKILTGNGMAKKKAAEIADLLTTGHWTHDYPIDFSQAKAMGLPVKDSLMEEAYLLMDLYPQAGQRRPSVQYIPVPYHREPDSQPSRGPGAGKRPGGRP